MKTNKLLKLSPIIGLMSIIPVLSVTSCSKTFYSSNDIGGLSAWLSENNLQDEDGNNNKIADLAKKIRNSTNPDDQANKNLLNQKCIQISTGGKVNDKSFNQLVWETISNFSKTIGNNKNRYYETLAIDQSMQNDAYDYAINNGFKIWVLTGFQQETLLSNWLKIGKNRQRFDDAEIKIITVDWYANDPTLIKPGRLLGLNFKTQESTFIIGYSLSKLLGELYPGDSNKKNRIINSTGGGDFSGVTNFNYGLYDGMRMWNQEQGDDDSRKVATTVVNDSTSVELGTSFAITNDSKQKIYLSVDGYGNEYGSPKATMTVAGPLTSVTLDRIRAKKSDQWVIGVDTDMSLTYTSNKDLILTSSEKKIAIAVYKALCSFYGLADALGDNKINEIEMDWENEDKKSYVCKVDGEFSNFNMVGGYAEGFVGVSKSTLKDDEIAKRFDEIVEESWIKFFGEDRVSGYFEEHKPTSKDPSTFINPKYGSMTAGNIENYFNKVIFKNNANSINSWWDKKARK